MASPPTISLAHPVRDAERDARLVEAAIREGRFQRSLSLVTAASSLVSGLEVAYEHYRGSYSRRVMYTPVILSTLLTGAAAAAVFSRRAARGVLRLTSLATLADCFIGFYFHARGIHRKPGGWRLPMTNMIMGPPIFAPLLFGTAAYLGLIASYLQREDAERTTSNSGRATLASPLSLSPTREASQTSNRSSAEDTFLARILPPRAGRELLSEEQDIREGRFQKQVAIVTAVSALLSGFEAYYSHYKNNFRYWVQWTPIVLAPLLAIAAIASIRNRRIARTALPALSLAACADAGVGFFYHARGVVRRPGGVHHLLYNIMYGPPIFAPLLFGAAGALGLLASLLRRSTR